MKLLDYLTYPGGTISLAPAALHRWPGRIGAICLALALPSTLLGPSPMAIFVGVGLFAYGLYWPLPLPTVGAIRFLLPPVTLVGALALIAYALSLPDAINPTAWTIWLQVAGLAALGLFAANGLARDRAFLELSLRVFIASLLVTVLYAHGTWYLDPALIEALRARQAPTPRDALHILKPFITMTPLAAPLALWAGFRLGGPWRWAGIALIPLVLLLAYNGGAFSAQGGFIAAAGAAAFVAVLVRLPRLAAGGLMAAAILLVVAAAVTVVQTVPRPPERPPRPLTIPTSLVDAHRQYIWGFVLHHAEKRPVLGYGMEGARKLPGSNRIIGQGMLQYVPAHPHNWAVQIYAETGLVGLAATLAWLLMLARWLIRAAARHRRASGDPVRHWLALAGAAIAGAFLAMSLYSFSIWSAWWLMAFFLMLAYVSAGLEHGRAKEGERHLENAAA